MPNPDVQGSTRTTSTLIPLSAYCARRSDFFKSGAQCSANHPSGMPEPSRADLALTKRLQDAMALVDVRVLDHIIVGGVETVSLAERGGFITVRWSNRRWHNLVDNPVPCRKNLSIARIRAAGVSFEDRQDLLGHKSGRMTTHYSAAELTRLIEATNSVCSRGGKQPELVILRQTALASSRKKPPHHGEACNSLIWWVVRGSNAGPSD